MKKIGFIGVGIMGKSMVRNLMKAGFELHIYARTRSKVEDVISDGAIFHETITDCVKDCDAVITIVGFPVDVEEVYFDKGNILDSAKEGAYLIDMTTTSPMLDQKIAFRRFYRAAFFLPSITSMVVVAIVWQWIYNPDYGLLNYFLSLFGIKGPKWLLDANTSLISLAIVGIWKRAGYDMIIFLSGLQGISNSYYEASMLDGANKWQQFRYITLPMLKPTTFFVFVMAVISSFQVFDQVMLMTKGGPGRSSSVLVHYLYQNAFQYFKLGYACAIAYLLFFIVMGVTVFNMRMEKSMREIY